MVSNNLLIGLLYKTYKTRKLYYIQLPINQERLNRENILEQNFFVTTN